MTAELHAFADAEPYERVADMRTVEMMLNVAAVDPCCAAGADCPTVAVVFLSDAAVGGEADIGGRTACGAVAVNKYGAVIGECFNDCGAGCGVTLDEFPIAAGCFRNGLSCVLVGIVKVGVIAVVRSEKQNVGGLCVLHCCIAAAALDGENTVVCGFGNFAEFVAEPVVVCAIHAVNGEVEAVLREVGEAVLINGVEVQCSGVNCIDDLGAAHALSKSVCFGCIECCPSVVEFAHCCCFVNETVNILCKRSNGNHCESHDERKRKRKELTGFHFFSS